MRSVKKNKDLEGCSMSRACPSQSLGSRFPAILLGPSGLRGAAYNRSRKGRA